MESTQSLHLKIVRLASDTCRNSRNNRACDIWILNYFYTPRESILDTAARQFQLQYLYMRYGNK